MSKVKRAAPPVYHIETVAVLADRLRLHNSAFGVLDALGYDPPHPGPGEPLADYELATMEFLATHGAELVVVATPAASPGTLGPKSTYHGPYACREQAREAKARLDRPVETTDAETKASVDEGAAKIPEIIETFGFEHFNRVDVERVLQERGYEVKRNTVLDRLRNLVRAGKIQVIEKAGRWNTYQRSRRAIYG